jgi:hypothetical protein
LDFKRRTIGFVLIMLLKDFYRILTEYVNEIGLNENGGVYSHPTYRANIDFYDEANNQFFDVDEIVLHRLLGCHCPADVIIKLRKPEDL